MNARLNTMDALQRVAEGRKVPRDRWAILIKLHLIKVTGHGKERRPRLTEAGIEALSAERSSS